MSDEQRRIDDLIIKGIDRVEDKVEKVEDKVGELRDKTGKIETDLHDLSSQFRSHEELFKAHLETDQKMYEEFSKMNEILRENTDSLKEHMAQTELVREEVKSARQMADNLKDALLKVDERLKPIEEEKLKKEAVKEYIAARWKKWLMILGAISTTLGIIGKLTGIF